MKRGDIYWVNLDPTQGAEIKKLRPCVIFSATPINLARNTVVVIPLSTAAKARPPLVVEVTCLGQNVTAVCDQIRAVNKKRLVKQAGNLRHDDMITIENGLRQVLLI